MAPAKIAASILSADFSRLGEEVKAVERYADMIHVDVMDAHFVPPLTIGPVVVESLRPVTDLPLHCHLMVERPQGLFEDLARAGTNMVTCHVEAVSDPRPVIERAHELGFRAGLAVNPETPVEAVFPHLDHLQNVIVMTLAKTGWAGQPFEEAALPKVEALRAEIDRRGLEVDLECDGGINEESGRRCLAAGATMLAAASSIFKAPDPAEAARRLADVARAG
ncbi:MAG: ribulose-phosphate 3-epimerase [Actinomycetota bacterium]